MKLFWKNVCLIFSNFCACHTWVPLIPVIDIPVLKPGPFKVFIKGFLCITTTIHSCLRSETITMQGLVSVSVSPIRSKISVGIRYPDSIPEDCFWSILSSEKISKVYWSNKDSNSLDTFCDKCVFKTQV